MRAAAGATVLRAPYNPGEPEQNGGQEMLIATFSDPDNNYQLMIPMA